MAISRQLLGKIIDEVFDGGIEDASVIEEIYASIKKHEPVMGQEECASLIDAMLSESPWKDQMWARGALMIASNTIRRGRHLTTEEKFQNVMRHLDDYPPTDVCDHPFLADFEKASDCIAAGKCVCGRASSNQAGDQP